MDLQHGIHRVWQRLAPLRRNGYAVGFAVFVVWVSFFDADSLYNILSARKRVRTLERQREYYMERIAQDRQRLNELQTDAQNLEKYARETYYMRRPDEDLFIIEEP